MRYSIGWVDKPSSISAFLKERWSGYNAETGANHECLDVKIDRIHAAYGAIRVSRGPRYIDKVIGIAGKLTYKQDSLSQAGQFRCVAKTEDEAPTGLVWCPESILDLLTPTSDSMAQAWRQTCRNNAQMKRDRQAKLKIGNILVPIRNEPVCVPGYGDMEELIVIKRGRSTHMLRSNRGQVIKPYPWLLDKLGVKQ